MSLLNVASGALIANQAALQTVGHNISNVNTVGYSRQNVVLETSGGQYTGGGYIGRGVTVANVTREHSDFLTKQSTLASSVLASDSARAGQLLQLEDIFPSGTSDLGAAVTDLLNSFSNVSSAPTDLTARGVVLTRAQELANRFSSASTQIDSLQTGTQQQLTADVTQVNDLIGRIAKINDQIASSQGQSQQPNDLLDQRDTLVRNLNQYVQTSQVTNSDGRMDVFMGSQALVLGNTTASVSLVSDPGGDPSKMRLAVGRGTATSTFDDSMVGGGEIAGLLKFNNTDIPEARNLLGRMALTTTTEVNDQHKLGIDLNGNPGTDFFQPITIPPGYAATSNTGAATITATVADATALAASDYQVQFTSGTTGQIVRLSDGQATAFASLAPATVDGLTFNLGAGAAAGDAYIVKPYATAAGQMGTLFTSPRQLAAGSPVVVATASDNTGTVTVASLQVTSQNASLLNDAIITFTSPTAYTITVPPAAAGPSQTYTSGNTISQNGWELTLKGTPAAGDVVMVQANDSTINTPLRDPTAWPTTYAATPTSTVGGPILTTAGNADALAALRDKATYDGSPMSDGYAGLISQLGTRVQSAQFTASVSQSISSNLDGNVASLTGVNLDEEAAKLLQYQQAYQASAKMIQISQSIFDSVISAMG
ncbi:MAG: flagellar hook-associated protein FlgK [Pseudomonadota bacterium]